MMAALKYTLLNYGGHTRHVQHANLWIAIIDDDGALFVWR